jgi:chemotaxis protein CheC
MTLNDHEKDTLQELINISFGMAASLVGDMLDSYVHINIPKIDILDINALDEELAMKIGKDNQFFITKQIFRGDFFGEIVFVFSKNDGERLTSLLLQNDANDDNEVMSAILELTNIITSACIGQLSELIQKESFFDAPSIELRENMKVFTREKALDYNHVILIETLLDLQNENIVGQMFVLSNEHAFVTLKEALNAF